MDGLHYASLRQTGGLYYVFTTRYNVSPSFALELLARLTVLFKDYCGVLNEESIRKNFVLIYELLDEVLVPIFSRRSLTLVLINPFSYQDYGYVQETATEQLKAFVFNEPILVDDPLLEEEKEGVLAKVSQFASEQGLVIGQQAASAVHKPITINATEERKARSEIYIDLIERLTVIIDAQVIICSVWLRLDFSFSVLFAFSLFQGNIVQSEIEGLLRITNFLQGNPEIRISLNEDLVIGRGNG